MARLVDLKILDLRRRLDVFEFEVDIGFNVRGKGVDIIQSGLGNILVGNADIDLTDVAGYTVVALYSKVTPLALRSVSAKGSPTAMVVPPACVLFTFFSTVFSS